MLYKKLLVEAIRKAGSYGQLPAGVLKFDWVVNIKPVGNGQAVLKYLAPYIYRVAICDNRILSVDEQGVTYRVKPSGERVYKTRHLDGESFVRAFAQHIPPPVVQRQSRRRKTHPLGYRTCGAFSSSSPLSRRFITSITSFSRFRREALVVWSSCTTLYMNSP